MIIEHKKFGFDLDNTLINYSKSVLEYCRSNKLSNCKNISELKQLLKKSDASNYNWQLAQGWLYSHGLKFAEPNSGSIELCSYLKSEGYDLFIVSHKTSHSPDFCGHLPLQDLAAEWIKNSLLLKFFTTSDQIFFEPTKDYKVKKIRELKLGIFVDDLEEVLIHSQFPSGTRRFLLSDSTIQNSHFVTVKNLNDIQKIMDYEHK